MFNNNNNNNNTSNSSSNNNSNSSDYHQYQENVVVEEEEEEVASGPEYRSVTMSMSMNMNQKMMRSQQIVTTDTPSLSSVPMLQKSPLSSPLRPLSLPLVPSTLIRASTNPTAGSNKERAVVPSSPSAASSPSSASASTSTSPSPHHQWIIRELHELPSDYSLVRTNVYVKQQDSRPTTTHSSSHSQISQPQEVADRLCQTLKSLSITVINEEEDHPMIDPNSTPNPFLDEEGSSEEEENVLFVQTHDDVKFAIRLFASSQNMIVVEIQRNSGCTFAFRDAATTLLRSVSSSAAKQTRTGPAGRAKRRFTIPLSLPKRSKEDLHKCIQDDFKIAYKMILSPKYETQVLGLESMEQMTRRGAKNKSGGSRNEEEVQNVAARSVLGQGNGGAREDGDINHPSCECLKQLLRLLETAATTTSTKSCPSSSCVLLQRKILTVLANSLEVLHNNNKTMSTIDNNGVSSSDPRSRTNDTATTHNNKNEEDRTRTILFLTTHTSFLSVLLSIVQATPVRRPHDTFPAVRCLRYLLLLVSCCARTGEECLVTAIRNTTHPTAMESILSYAGGTGKGKGNGIPPSHHHHHHDGLEQESTLLLAQLQQQQL